MTADDYAQWRVDETVLAQLGANLARQDLRVNVALPRSIAEQAVLAWSRDHEHDQSVETTRESRTRTRAGILALIGLSIHQTGQWSDDQVVTDIDAWLIGAALDAADAAGLMQSASTGT